MKWIFTTILFIPVSLLYSQERETRTIYEHHFKGWTIHSNFSMPMVRFNLFDEVNLNEAFGRLLLFQSVGAGVNFSWGNIHKMEYTNDPGKKDVKFQNILGFHLGLLFSAESKEEKLTTVFAPTIGINLLDLQFGLGYELGDIEENETGWFFSIAYGIPLHKLSSTGSFILTKSH